MRVVLCTSGGLPGAAVLRTLRHQVSGIVLSTRIDAWQHYRRSGLRYTTYLGCALFRRLPREGLPTFPTRDINDAAARAFIDALKPGLVVSAFFNQRIGAGIEALNIHPSLLPALKGVDPVFYARLRNAPLGVTVHRVSPEFDSGEIVAQEAVTVPPDETVLATTVRLYARGARLLLDSLGGPAVPQSGSGNYDSWPKREDVKALRRKGVRLVRLRDLLARAP